MTPAFPYDIEKAKALMAESGYPDGFETSILALAGNQDELGIATALQQMWSQIGIKLEIRQVDNATRTQEYRNGVFDMRVAAWTNDIADPGQITSYFAYSPTIDALHSGWKNEEVDALYVASQSEMQKASGPRSTAKIQEVFNTTGPIIPLYETPYPVALQKKASKGLSKSRSATIYSAPFTSRSELGRAGAAGISRPERPEERRPAPCP